MVAWPLVHRAVGAVLLLAAFAGACPAQARAELRRVGGTGEREVVVANRGAVGINELYVSPSTSEEWGDDRLGRETLAPGRSRRLRLGRGADCVFDLQAVYEDGRREERHRVDLCRERQIVLDGSAAVAPADEAARHTVVVINEAARPIQQVLISPADSGDWGDDLLDSTSLSVGERATVAYRGSCLADLRVVYDNRAAEERRNVDLCGLGGVRVRPGWTTADVLAPLVDPRPGPAPGSGAAPAPAPAPAPVSAEVLVANHSGHAARQLFLAPVGASERGPDLLGNGELADGATLTLRLVRPSDTCRFDAHVVYGGKAPDQDFRGLDLCRDPSLVLLPQT